MVMHIPTNSDSERARIEFMPGILSMIVHKPRKINTDAMINSNS
jgi:hypothetical protein